MAEPLALGTFVHPFGRVAAVVFTDGERYYLMEGHDGAIAFMPATVIETEPSHG